MKRAAECKGPVTSPCCRSRRSATGPIRPSWKWLIDSRSKQSSSNGWRLALENAAYGFAMAAALPCWRRSHRHSLGIHRCRCQVEFLQASKSYQNLHAGLYSACCRLYTKPFNRSPTESRVVLQARQSASSCNASILKVDARFDEQLCPTSDCMNGRPLSGSEGANQVDRT